MNTPATTNVQLKIGQTTQVVTVASAAPPLNMVDASLANSFDQTQVTQIPLEGRNVPDLLGLQAGVAYTGNRPDTDDPRYKDQDTRNGAVNGARSDQGNLTLDGVDVSYRRIGSPPALPLFLLFLQRKNNYSKPHGIILGLEIASNRREVSLCAAK